MKNSFVPCLWYVTINLPQNKNVSTSLERSYKELLNALISFEIHHLKLKLWAVKERLNVVTYSYLKDMCRG